MNRHTVTRLLALLVLALLAVTAGCNRPPKKRQFKNILAKRNAEHSAKAKDFYKTIAPLKDNQAVGSPNVRSSLDECKKTLNKTQDVMLNLSPPRGSESGKDYYIKYREFLNSQQKIYDEVLVVIAGIVDDNRQYPTPGHKWAAIDPLLKKAEQIERPVYDDLSRAQQEFSTKHGFAPK